VALFAGQAFIGSRTGGLLVVGDGAVRALRPSLRARALHVSCGQLVVVSDLLLGVTDDGADFVSRDLAGYVRLADKLG
jgi:hypothetical protein